MFLVNKNHYKLQFFNFYGVLCFRFPYQNVRYSAFKLYHIIHESFLWLFTIRAAFKSPHPFILHPLVLISIVTTFKCIFKAMILVLWTLNLLFNQLRLVSYFLFYYLVSLCVKYYMYKSLVKSDQNSYPK